MTPRDPMAEEARSYRRKADQLDLDIAYAKWKDMEWMFDPANIEAANDARMEAQKPRPRVFDPLYERTPDHLVRWEQEGDG